MCAMDYGAVSLYTPSGIAQQTRSDVEKTVQNDPRGGGIEPSVPALKGPWLNRLPMGPYSRMAGA